MADKGQSRYLLAKKSFTALPAWAWNPENEKERPPCLDPTVRDVIEAVPALYTLRGTQREHIAEISHLTNQDETFSWGPLCEVARPKVTSFETLEKNLVKLAKLTKFLFYRHFQRFEVGQLGHSVVLVVRVVSRPSTGPVVRMVS